MDSILVLIIFILFFIGFGIFDYLFKRGKRDRIRNASINELSYQKYANFYGEDVFQDEFFNGKIDKIRRLIEVEKVRDLNEIATFSGCHLEECILKIRYLQNKRQLSNIHIDRRTNKLIECTKEELKLINKYSPYIYFKHLSIDEMVVKLRRSNDDDIKSLRNEIYRDLKYLCDNDLINGIKMNDVDKEVIYYSIEKRHTKDVYINVVCPNCGAKLKVQSGNKTRCEYCETIIDNTTRK